MQKQNLRNSPHPKTLPQKQQRQSNLLAVKLKMVKVMAKHLKEMKFK